MLNRGDLREEKGHLNVLGTFLDLISDKSVHQYQQIEASCSVALGPVML